MMKTMLTTMILMSLSWRVATTNLVTSKVMMTLKKATPPQILVHLAPQESTWTATLKRVPIQTFTSSLGPSLDIPSSPVEVFDLFFSPDLLQIIVRESNAYAKIVMGNDKYEKWSKITMEEVKAFLGFSVLMGINHLPSLNDYWSRDPHLRYAPVADCITRDRFRDISRFHLCLVERRAMIVSVRSDR